MGTVTSGARLSADAAALSAHRARAVHGRGIEQHFEAHLTTRDLEAITHALQKVRDHVRPRHPGGTRP